MGAEHASIVLLTFTNHSCRYCLEFEEDYIPRLVEDFVKPGKLRLQISILKLRKYPESVLFANALLCAAERGKGFPMHTKLFELSPDRRVILDAAGSLSMDTEQFGACLDAMETAEMLGRQSVLADTLGVEYVPTFFYDGEKAVGLPAYADMRGTIETLLREMR